MNMAQDKSNTSLDCQSFGTLESASAVSMVQDQSYISVSGSLVDFASKPAMALQDQSVASEGTQSMGDLESSMCGSNPAVPTSQASVEGSEMRSVGSSAATNRFRNQFASDSTKLTETQHPTSEDVDDLLSLESGSVINARRNPFACDSEPTGSQHQDQPFDEDLLSVGSASVTNKPRNPFLTENEQADPAPATTAGSGRSVASQSVSVVAEDVMSIGSQSSTNDKPRNPYLSESKQADPIPAPPGSVESPRVSLDPKNPFSNPDYLLEPNEPEEKEIPHIIDPGVDDDVSTIANDTVNGSFLAGGLLDVVPVIPSAISPKRLYQEKVMRTPKKSPVRTPGSPDDVTLPETPPPMGANDIDGPHGRKNRSIFERNEKDFNRLLNSRLRRVVGVAGCLGIILLGAVAVLSVSLYQYRRRDDGVGGQSLRSPHDDSEPIADIVIMPSAPIAPIPIPGLTFVMPGSSPIAVPTSPLPAPINPPTSRFSFNNSSSAVDFVRDTILQVSPKLDLAFNDTNSTQFAVLQWLAEDPSLSNYNQSKIVQRFALSSFFLSVTESGNSMPRFGRSLRGLQDSDFSNWMSYSDECYWYSTKPEEVCDSDGIVRAIHLVDLGLHGSLPPELSLLSNSLERLNLDSNPIYGTIPTEYGRLTNLRVLRVTDCAIEGTIPAELGALSKLFVAALGRNQLTGSIPMELSTMTSLEFLSLSSNKLTGFIPAELGALSSLSTLLLSNNPSLTGYVPDEICSIGDFTRLEVDCGNIACSCCTSGCSVLTPAPSENTSSPTMESESPTTSNPSVANPIATAAPVTTAAPVAATAAPIATESPQTSAPTDGTTQQCVSSWITAGQACYSTSDAIEINLEYCDFRQFDLVAMFEASEDQNFSHNNAIFWLRSCGEQQCHGVLSNGYLTFDGWSPIWLSSPWPLRTGDYKLYLIRVSSGGQLVAHAESAAFSISDSCF